MRLCSWRPVHAVPDSTPRPPAYSPTPAPARIALRDPPHVHLAYPPYSPTRCPTPLPTRAQVFTFTVDMAKGAGLGLSNNLVVTRVVAGSPAIEQGLAVGCRILAVGLRRVETLAEFKEAFTACRARGDPDCVIQFRRPNEAEATAMAVEAERLRREEAARLVAQQEAESAAAAAAQEAERCELEAQRTAREAAAEAEAVIGFSHTACCF